MLVLRLLMRVKVDIPIWFSPASFFGWVLGLLALGSWWLASMSPYWTDEIYSQKIFFWLSGALSWLPGQVPFSISDLLLALLILALVLNPIRFFIWSDPYGLTGWRLLIKALISELAICWVVFALLIFLWGLNYQRQSTEQLFKVRAPLSEQERQQALDWAVENTNELRLILAEDNGDWLHCGVGPQWRSEHSPYWVSAAAVAQWERQVMGIEQAWLGRWQLPVQTTVATRSLLASQLFKELGLAGVYNPLLAQPNVNRFLHPLVMPFTIAHERAHFNGFADEDSANLVSYLMFWQADDPYLQYSAWVHFWLSVGRHPTLDKEVARDLDCVHRYNQQWRSHPAKEKMWQSYDKILKAAGSEQGVKSYRQGEELALRAFYQPAMPPN